VTQTKQEGTKMNTGYSNYETSPKDLQFLNRGTLDATLSVNQDDLENVNFLGGSNVNPLLTAATPLGILSGAVVGISGDGEIGLGTSGRTPVGLAVRNSAGVDWESMNSSASGGLTFAHGASTTVVVPVYTQTVAGITYTAGDKLYAADATGLLTNVEPSVNKTVIGVVTIAPSTSNAGITLQMRI